jgi:Family of unknown function (DUF6272)
VRLAEFDRFRGVALDVGVLFYFSGEFTSTVVAALSDSLRRKLDERRVEAPLKRRLFSTFVEMSQNILHYAADGIDDGAAESEGWADGVAGRRGVVAMGAQGEDYWVVCGNHVPLALRPRMEGKLSALQGLTPDELRDAYRRKLLDEDHERTDTVSKGAGLGLLTMARASSAPLEWLFADHPEPGSQLVTFYLCARLTTAAPPPRSTT